MNLERLEMMRVMMERVVAGSWEPDQSIMAEINRPRTTPLQVNRVNLHSWRNPTDERNVCGYSACAVGHACFDAEFRKMGMKWNGAAPLFKHDGGWDAVKSFFEIDKRLAEMLFSSAKYGHRVRNRYNHLSMHIREAKMVADRIQELLDHGKQFIMDTHGY